MTAAVPDPSTGNASARLGFVDLQVNGYAGVDFNSPLTVGDLERVCTQLRDDGVASILATVITDDVQRMTQRITELRQARDQSPVVRDVIAGIHIEGPFISPEPGYVGAHPAAAVRPAELLPMQRLVAAGEGLVRIVTLAPEHDDRCHVTKWLTDNRIVVSAGHCNPSLERLRMAIDHGLSMFTHLGNGCPRQLDRHDNIIQRVLSLAKHLWIGFIADGIHVPFPALGNYLAAAGISRAFVVTDAISAAGLGPGCYRLGEREVVVDEQLATWSADGAHLAGAATTMPRAYQNLQEGLGLSAEDAQRLTVDNPTAAIAL